MFGWLFGRKKKREVPSFDIGELARRQQQLIDQNKAKETTQSTLEKQEEIIFKDTDTLAEQTPKLEEQEKLELEQAIANYDKDLKSDPNNCDLWFKRGKALSKLSRYEEAINSCDKALKINHNLDKAWHERGKSLYFLERYKEAITSYDKCIKINDNYYQAWGNRGLALHNLGRYKEAITNYDKALKINPDNGLLWYARGTALLELYYYEEVIENYDKALEFNYNNIRVWHDRGIAYYRLHRYQEAIESYKNIAKKNSEYHKVHHAKSVVFYDLGRYKEALVNCNQSLRLNPHNYLALAVKGVILKQLTQHSAAIEYCNQAIKIEPSHWHAWGSKGSSLYETKGEQIAIEIWKEGLSSLNVEASDYNFGAGLLYRNIGKAHYQTGHKLIGFFLAEERYLKSINAYNQALDILCYGEHPFRLERLCNSIEIPNLPLKNKEMCLEVLVDLINSYSALNQLKTATFVRNVAVELLESLILETPSEGRKIIIARKFSSFYQLEIDRLAESPETIDHITALTKAEARKNLTLHWLYNNKYEDIPSPDFNEIKTFLQHNPPNTTLIFWHLSPVQLTTFILCSDATGNIELLQPQIVDLQAVTQLETLLKNWRTEYQESRKSKIHNNEAPSDWQKHLSERIQQLIQILQLDQWLGALQNCQNLILIPHRDLHLLPLHTCITQAWQGTNPPNITHLPSIKQGILNQKYHQHQPTFANRFLLEASGENSLYSELEAAILRGLLQPQIILNEPTKPNAIETLQQKVDVFHFTGHGEYNLAQNSHSGLILNDGDRLTLSELIQTDLPAYNLVSLSACETAIAGQASLIDEFVGFSAAFLYHRTRYILSTLWTVPETSAVILMVEFYRRLLENPDLNPIEALQQTQQWLAQATNQQLADWYEQWLTQFQHRREKFGLTRAVQRQIEKFRQTPHKIPYGDPYHWAGYTMTGC